MSLISTISPTPENAIELDKVYRVMALRLKNHWSAYELSWLLGYRDLYVRDVENPFHKLQYSSADTNYLIKIFGGSYSNIIATKIEPAIWQISIDTIIGSDGLKQYSIYHHLENKKRVLLYKALEEPKKKEYSEYNTALQVEVDLYLLELLNGDYFSSPNTHLDVYQTFIEKFDAPLQPILLINAVGKLTRQHTKPKLGKGKNTDMARATLIKLN